MMVARWTGVQVLDVVPQHVVQRAGQPELLVRVPGAVAQPPERVVYLPVREFDQVKCVGCEGHPGGGAGAVGGGHAHRQVPQRGGVPGEQVFLRGGSTALGQAQGAAARKFTGPGRAGMGCPAENLAAHLLRASEGGR